MAIETKGKVYYYHFDGLGSVTALTDAKGKVAQRYEYDSFGNLKHHGHKVKQPYTYTGRERDRETGLYYYRARYYDPKVGRFINKDPVGFEGGINLYVYLGNNPINFIDPLGLDRLHFNGANLFWLNNQNIITRIYDGISGPYGQGSLPEGAYTGNNLRRRNTQGMMCGENGWSLDLNPEFQTGRTLLRIHPDQPPTGTLGCIGVNCNDAWRLYNDLNNYFNSGNTNISVEVRY
ncbi:MAG: hypothetical protein HY578_06145 [Nitrospinae bacterium]|nr:hypothetical protein [Nitrospinota bacterium]